MKLDRRGSLLLKRSIRPSKDGAPLSFVLRFICTLAPWHPQPAEGQKRSRERHLLPNPGILQTPAPPMAPSKRTHLLDMKAVPAAWTLEAVWDAWAHTACWHYRNYARFQKPLDLLEQRLTELWEPNLAAELFQRGRAELQRCSVQFFTNEGLVREGSWYVYGAWPISDWSWLEAPCQRLAQRLMALTEDSAAEEATKRRRVEEDKSAAHELQKAKEESARLEGRLEKAEGDPNCSAFFWGVARFWILALTEGQVQSHANLQFVFFCVFVGSHAGLLV